MRTHAVNGPHTPRPPLLFGSGTGPVADAYLPFIGRGPELDVLRAGIQTAVAGRGAVVVLAGEPGAGKTRLASELTAPLAPENVEVVWGRCWEGDGVPSYWPWIQVVRALLHTRAAEALVEGLGPAKQAVCELVPELDGLRTMVASSPTEPAAFHAMDGLSRLLTHTAGQRPLVIVIEDLQRADAASLRMLEFLSGAVADSSLFVLATYRDDELNARPLLVQTLAELQRYPTVQGLVVPPFSAAEVSILLERASGTVPSADVVEAVYGRSEGNPLFVNEFVRLFAAKSGLVAAGLEPETVVAPATIREAIDRRLQRLSPDCWRLLAVASVIGIEFSVSLLQRVSRHAPDVVWRAIEEAVRAHFISAIPHMLGGYRFTRRWIRDALRDDLPRRVRLLLQHETRSAIGALARHESNANAESPSSAPLPQGDAAAARANIFRREGQFWRLSYDGECVFLKDAKGLQYVARLLAQPHIAFPAAALASAGGELVSGPSARLGALGDSGTILDAQATAAYKQRLRDLDVDLSEAQRFNDVGRIAALRTEIEMITQQLTAAVGWKGRARLGVSVSERARVSVRNDIARALDRIRQHHDALWRHLSNALKTGTLCSYRPDRRTNWEL